MIAVTSLFGDASFRPLLSFVREHRATILEQFTPTDFCLALIDGRNQPDLVTEALALLAPPEPDVQDYAISSAYARLIGEDVRKALSEPRRGRSRHRDAWDRRLS